MTTFDDLVELAARAQMTALHPRSAGWEHQPETRREWYRANVRPILEAVMPRVRDRVTSEADEWESAFAASRALRALPIWEPKP